jgi:hypothetical protein
MTSAYLDPPARPPTSKYPNKQREMPAIIQNNRTDYPQKNKLNLLIINHLQPNTSTVL